MQFSFDSCGGCRSEPSFKAGSSGPVPKMTAQAAAFHVLAQDLCQCSPVLPDSWVPPEWEARNQVETVFPRGERARLTLYRLGVQEPLEMRRRERDKGHSHKAKTQSSHMGLPPGREQSLGVQVSRWEPQEASEKKQRI